MSKILFILLLIVSNISFASTKAIDNKIKNNKNNLNKNVSKKKQTSLKVKSLANKINIQNKNIIKLEKNINKVNTDIDEHEKLLEESKSKLEQLREKSSNLIKEKKGNEVQIVDTIIEDFSTSIALKLASKNTLGELIDSEIYTILSENSKDQILKLDNNYDLLTNNTKKNKKKIKTISTYIEKRKKTKKTLNTLKNKHSKSLSDLENQHKSYQKELKKVVEQQESLKKLLSNLNILKEAELRKERIRRAKLQRLLAQKKKKAEAKRRKNSKSSKKVAEEVQTAEVRNQKYAKNLNLDVKKIGSSNSGVKVVRYRGAKTIAPLKSFNVVKKFGTYYDPIYKIKLFNESIVLKTKRPKAKVVSVLNGKVVYAKKNSGMLENVVIIQHENGLHTIYSHLDEIAPTLKVGKWIKKGYVVGRVDKNLTFQATKNSSHINPKDLFRI
ncbi:MAG: peptidase M23 [Arcobacter sp.]|uniref:Peptidoglycan DD-metalloendopeptidase family protein n=2 Tax=Poseidonibacter ostreae TaxID=2654171 RepID=A0A6L4WS47_9BACT|nr:M23 family metallopeptidase [Poseidonibacter ostreae]KAB7885533.1 peptidoglycan DD-metalloendopeptidase family protein [Poseidonibacter ostreae]KAB7888488.1 peptidoglycan DD-metalloendopeptidase family protein [Poseidonibacter ostreae]KAB7890745.1 peptidoglycan DD-metalloendopeptidase family protein [Poseidonibacter ostreae]MAC85199.1 peptidase M23 [Arcobacter sp.]